MQSVRAIATSLIVGSLLGMQVLAAAAYDMAAQYPELPVAKNYIHVARISVDAWNRKLKLPTQGKAAAFEYIFRTMPVREFEHLMLQNGADLKRGHTDVTFRKTQEYRRAYEGCDWVSQKMAIGIVRDALRVYERKFLKPDPLTAPLFAANSQRETETNIAGIERKVSRSEFLRETKSTFPLRSGDEFYFYRIAFGGGYLIARNNKVVKEDEGIFEY
jgi:hypothetical protein